MKKALAILWMVTLAAGLSLSGGCAVVESEDVKTSGMWAHFVIDHHPDDSVVAWAVLRVGGQTGTIIDLVGDDYMECNGTRMTEYVEAITNFHWNNSLAPRPVPRSPSASGSSSLLVQQCVDISFQGVVQRTLNLVANDHLIVQQHVQRRGRKVIAHYCCVGVSRKLEGHSVSPFVVATVLEDVLAV